jgi:hypothetical protein
MMYVRGDFAKEKHGDAGLLISWESASVEGKDFRRHVVVAGDARRVLELPQVRGVEGVGQRIDTVSRCF